MKMLTHVFATYLCSIPSAFALIETTNHKVASTVTSGHVLNWAMGLVIVLSLFFACIWFMRKMGALPTTDHSAMRVVAGLSLGVREKLVLVQVGEKQLLLGVTPGKVSNLLVLEGSDQIYKEKVDTAGQGEFSQKLKQLLAGSNHE